METALTTEILRTPDNVVIPDEWYNRKPARGRKSNPNAPKKIKRNYEDKSLNQIEHKMKSLNIQTGQWVGIDYDTRKCFLQYEDVTIQDRRLLRRGKDVLTFRREELGNIGKSIRSDFSMTNEFDEFYTRAELINIIWILLSDVNRIITIDIQPDSPMKFNYNH